MPDLNNYSGQVAVITGAGSGIGAALALACAKRGMAVIGGDVDTAGLAQTAADIAALQGSFHSEQLDVRNPDAVDTFAEKIFSKHKKVRFLFNNAGVLVDGKSWEQSHKDWKWNFDVNVLGVVNGIRAFVPAMLKQGAEGLVVNTASIGGLMGGGGFLAPYQGTKHAVAAISESLYAELAREEAPVSAACLCPADTATSIWESQRLLPDDEKRDLGTEDEQQFHDFVAGMCSQGMTPEQVAEHTLEAIESGKFWIFPDEGFKAIFEQRVQSILNESSPPSPEEIAANMAKYEPIGGKSQ